LTKEEVLNELKKTDGNIVSLKEIFNKKYGEKIFEPLSEEELAKKAKSEFLPTFSKGKEVTNEFKDFYYNNDMQEQIWKQIKEKTVEQYKQELEQFDKDFPALNNVNPNKSSTKHISEKEAFEITKINNEKLSILEKSFPTVDKKIIEYILYNFSYQLPAAMNYLKTLYPDNFVEIMKSKESSEIKSEISLIHDSKLKAYQMPQQYKKREKPVYENNIPNISRQMENSPGMKYGEIRRDADTYLRMMRIYMKNEAFAHAIGQHSEAGKFRQMAEEYCDMYSDAKHKAMLETINQRHFL